MSQRIEEMDTQVRLLGFTWRSLIRLKHTLDCLGYASDDETDCLRFEDDLFNARIKTPREIAIAYHQKEIDKLNAEAVTAL